MSEKLKFTKKILSDLVPREGVSRTYVYDTEVNGLCLSITKAGTKSFLVYRKVKGKPVRVTLGRFPDMTIEQARKIGKKKISDLVEGINPIEAKRAEDAAGVTLSEALNDYIEVRGKNLADSTISGYKTVVNKHLKEWRKKPLSEITRDRVAKKHAQLSKVSATSANTTMRVLRALFNFANGQYEDKQGKGLFPDNPVSRLTHTRSWNKEARRSNKINNSQLKSWFQAISEVGRDDVPFNQVASDYLTFLVLTGLRRREAAKLKAKDVDFKEHTFTVTETKNGIPLTLPMTNYIEELLRHRCLETPSDWVFPSVGKEGYIHDPRRVVRRVREISGVDFTIHDLRRTFISIAESLDIPAYALKRLVNHSTGGDVTAGYIIMDVERLRKPMQLITDFILGAAEINQASNVVSIADRLEEKV